MTSSITFFKKYQSNFSGLTYHAWQGIMISFVESILMGISCFLSLYFVNELHLSAPLASMLMSFFGLGAVVGGLMAGKLSDRLIPKTIVIASLIIQALAYACLVKLKSIALLMFTLIMLGIGSYGFITANHLFILSYCRKIDDRLKAINILDLVSNLGLAIAGTLMACISPFHLSFIFTLSTFVLCSIVLYLIYYYPNQSKLSVTEVSHLDLDTSSSTHSKVKYYALVCLFLAGFIISQTSSTYPIYIQNIFPEMGTSSVSILFSLNASMVVILQAPLVNSLAHINKSFLIGIGALLLGIGMVLLNFSSIFLIALIACGVMTVGEMLFFSITQLICYESSSVKNKGHGLGAYRSIFALSRIVGPAMGGMIYRLGNDELWYVCFFLGLSCFIPAFYFKKFA